MLLLCDNPDDSPELDRVDDSPEFDRVARDLLLRYGPVAPRVAREWAEIKSQQGAPETAAMWRRIAATVVRASDA